MELGIHFASFSGPGGAEAIGPTLATTAKVADEGGCTTFTLMDHFFQIAPLGPPEAPMLEGYTALGFVAGQTRLLQLGLLVTGVTYRHPALLAKIVTTLDVVSGGRAFLGLGAAWYEREHLGLGVPFPPVTERFERLEEALQICVQMWSDDNGPFVGKHHHLAETVCSPRPLRSPRPPILIGGGGERKTLRLVAQYADACNLAGSVDVVRHKLEVLAGHCAAIGRDPAEIRTTVVGVDGGNPLTDPDGFIASMESYAALGVQLVEYTPFGDDPAGDVARLCETVVPRLAELG